MPDSKRILASCGSQAGLPAFTLVGEEGVELLLFVPGRGEPRAWELTEVSGRLGRPLWELEREWWRETKLLSHSGLSRVLCASVTPVSSSRGASALAYRQDRASTLGLVPLPLVGTSLVCFARFQCSLPGPSLLFASQTSPASL